MLNRITAQSADRLIALVVGHAGIGKTSLLRTIPQDANVCVLSAEAGLLCVRDLVQSGRVQGFEIQDFASLAEAYTELQKEESKKAFQWIFIDSLTEIASRCVEAMKAKYPDRKDSFPMWGEYADRMTALIKGFRDMTSYNVVFTCLDSVEKDDNNKRYIGPSISGSALKERLASYFDEVFYMISTPDQNGNERRIFVCQPWDRYPAKDRSGKLDTAETPDLSAISEKIFGKNTATKKEKK
jgi:hypothetical protein